MNLKLLSLLVMMIFSLCSYSQNITIKTIDGWVYIGQDIDSNRFYMKDKPVSSEDGIIKIWTKNTAQIEKILDKTYKNVTMLMLNEFDCARKKTRLLAYTYYTSKGKLIVTYSYNETQAAWEDIIPETVSEQIANKACAMFR